MSVLEIKGRESSPEQAIVFAVDGFESSATTVELEALRRRFRMGAAVVSHDGVRLDEAQVTTLIAADADIQPLWPLEACRDCGADATQVIEGEFVCHAYAVAFGAAEDDSMDAAS